MSVSRVVLGSLITLIVATAGCRVTVETKERWVEDNVRVEDKADWLGQKITIRIDGVGLAKNGGVEVIAEPGSKRVAANARMLAMAFDKPDADQSIVDAKATYTITSSPTEILVTCGHGGTHGSSEAGMSGCELVKLTVPVGSADQPLDIKVLGGNGDMTLQFREAFLKNLAADNKSAISAEVPNTVGGGVDLVASQGDDIAVTLPAQWAADEVIVEADADKIANAFTDAKIGPGAGGRGTKGTGLALLKLRSVSFAGSTGDITLR